MLTILGALLIGFTLGLLGSGGSILTVPVLVYLLHHNAKAAIAESLAIVGTIALAGVIPYGRSRHIDWRSVAFFGVPGMGGTYAGAWLARLLPATVQLVLFAGVMLLAAWMMFRNAPHGSNDIDAARPRQAIWKITLEGLAVGVVTGVVGVGGGFLIVPALVLLCGLPMPAAVGTSLMVIALNAFTGLIKYHDVLAGLNVTVDWTTVGWFAGIGIVGMLVGRRVGQNMPRRTCFFRAAGRHGRLRPESRSAKGPCEDLGAGRFHERQGGRGATGARATSRISKEYVMSSGAQEASVPARDHGAAKEMESVHHHVLIVGGGSAGLTVAARLTKGWFRRLDVAVIEPSDRHYYQPLWTLVGGGVFPKEASVRSEASVMPRRANWIRDAVNTFHPEQNYVLTHGGRKVSYDWLVVAAGIHIDWEKIPGLKESIGKGGVCSNYSYDTVDYTWETIRGFRGGNAVFTHPSGAIKCGGAPQKIMYLAEDYFRRAGVRDKTRVLFCAAGRSIFSVDKYRSALERIIERKQIECHFRHELTEIRPQSKEAVFKNLDSGEVVTISYEMLHVTPPMSPPAFIASSPLADKAGWVEVDKETLQHVRFPNVFALGDCSSLPTSKTGAAIRKQAPVLVRNLKAAMAGKPLIAKYNGYTSCPIVTGYGSLILAEFDYDRQPAETFPFDQSKERWSMWLLKKYLLPLLYWKGMLKGRA
jgi:sulfide:quinone oxidoreductase